MRTLGLLGGMTFESTGLYYDLINKHIRSELGGRRSARLFLFSVDQEPMLQFATAGQWDQFAGVLSDAAKTLKMGGADALVICASLAHKVTDAVETEVGLPLLHVADFTANAIIASRMERVGLLGTKAVMEDGFVKGRLEKKFGLEVLVPGLDDRQRVNKSIIEELTTGVVRETKAFFLSTVADLVDQGAEGLILGSTDLGFVLKKEDISVPLFDTAKLHARGVAEWAIEEDKRLSQW